MRTTMLATALGLSVLLVGVAGCGSDDDTAATSTTAAPAAPASTTTGADDVATTTGADEPTTSAVGSTTTVVGATTTIDAPATTVPDGFAAALDLFRQLRDEHCTEAPTPEPVSTEPAAEGADKQVIVVDAVGNRLVVDVDDRVVYSLDGPEGVLPAAYSFGCDPDVFQGTLDH